MRIMRKAGQLQKPDGTLSTLPVDVALAGIFPFESPRRARFPEDSTSLIDHGMITLGAANLHRVTIEEKSVGISSSARANTVLTDFYFDSSSHLLVKSATFVPVPGARNVRFLFVTTYSDYRVVGTTLVPFRFEQTMDGQPLETLQLTTVTLAPTLASAYFRFD